MKHRCPRQQQSQNMAKIYVSYILTPTHPQAWHVMSVKCEEPIDDLTVQVWLLYHQPNFKYCTLFVSGAVVAQWLSSWLVEQEDRGSIPGLAT